MGFPYIPPPLRSWIAPTVDKAPNPWNLMQDYLKAVVTLAASILAVTVTFANTLVGTNPSTPVIILLGLSWLFLLITIGSALFAIGPLIGYLRGIRPRPAPAPLLCNVAYFSLFVAVALFGTSGIVRILITKPPSTSPASLQRLGDIGPFPTSSPSLCEPTITAAACRALTAPVFDQLGIAPLTAPHDVIILIGSTDRQRLGKQLADRYDNNASLARARTDWVSQALREHYPNLAKATRFLSVYQGAHFTNTDASNEDLAADRHVEVWAIIPTPSKTITTN